MNEPLVSLLLLSYNYERFVVEAIRSVLAQTYPRWELIVSDDASTDGSLAAIRSFSDPRIRVLAATRNEGPAVSYNRAYRVCRGDFIGSLDADDFLAADKLARQLAHFADHPQVDILGTYVTEVDEAGRVVEGELASWHNQDCDLDRIENWLMRNHLCHSSVLLRRAVHQRLGTINPHLRASSDYELWLRGLAEGARFAVVPERLCFSRQHESNLWRRIPRSDLFLELAYLLAARLGPHLIDRGEGGSIASAVAHLIDAFLPAASAAERVAACAELERMPIASRDYPSFAADNALLLERARSAGAAAIASSG